MTEDLFLASDVDPARGNPARGLSAVTEASARAVKLKDRGTLAPGKRADLIRFRLRGDLPPLAAQAR